MRRFGQALLAVLIGNIIYFLLLVPRLPTGARHVPFHLDLGLMIDFAICAAVYAALEYGLGRRGT